MRTSYPAVPETVPRARAEVADFAASAGMPEVRLHAVRLAVSEAVTNAVQHAYNGAEGGIELCAAVAGEELWVLVSDSGDGLKINSNRGGLGLGFALIALSADNFTIAQRSSGGIELRIGFALRDDSSGSEAHDLGSVASAIAPAPARFSTTR